MANKGITQRGKNWVAQYWNKELKTTVHIGVFETELDAINARANYLRDVHDGKIDDSLPKTKGLPKGVVEQPGNHYGARLQFLHGRNKEHHVHVHIGTYKSPQEAETARKNFIKDLF